MRKFGESFNYLFNFQMRWRWKYQDLLAVLALYIVGTSANDSTLFECPKGRCRYFTHNLLICDINVPCFLENNCVFLNKIVLIFL